MIDLKKARFDRSKRPSFEHAPRDHARVETDGTDQPKPIKGLHWPVASLNKTIRDVESRITKELRDGIASHDPAPLLHDLKTEVTQVQSRLDKLNERIELLCAPPARRSDREVVSTPPKDVNALEILLVELAEKIDTAITDRPMGAGVFASADTLTLMEERRYPSTLIGSFGQGEATFRQDIAEFGPSAERLSDGPTIQDMGMSFAQRPVFRAETQSRAFHARVKWTISDREATTPGSVRTTLMEAARRAMQRSVVEIKSMQGRSFPDHELWAGPDAEGTRPSRTPWRDRLSGMPSLPRTAVFGIAGALLVFGGYSLSRPGAIGSNVASPKAPERVLMAAFPLSVGRSEAPIGGLSFGMDRANAAESLTPSLGRGLSRPETERSGGFGSTAPLQYSVARLPVDDRASAAGGWSAWDPQKSEGAPNVGSNTSEADVRALAAQGDPRAQYELATRLLMRQEKGPDAKDAADWLEKAASQGFALAQLRLGILYGKGVGVNRDYAAARKWFQAAAENGNALAMHNLAVLISDGHGRKPDPAAANAWFRKAAELGVLDSQYNLGLDYMQGLGVERDLVQSYAWFATAAAAGDAKASRKRKEVAALLDPEELDTARILADRLKQKQASLPAGD
ncbi:hypothetical protein B1812_15220 [Methylocystis bryophila]|uniref:Sel1 repeat family protein n=1 Tax=Methylocystis bryophila TaxID=655015 RepID=A0A1W6MXB5_9HYPH|nr:hypothetical protein B1812_15220 [Methylocystis bryophila]